MLTNQKILKIAMEQLACDCNCAPEDFLKEQNVVSRSKEHPKARKYLKLTVSCDMVSYGSNIVAQASAELAPLVQHQIRPQCHPQGLPPGLGAGDRKACGIRRPNESGVKKEL